MRFHVGQFAREFGLWGLFWLIVGFIGISLILERFIESEKIRNGILFGLGIVAAVVTFYYKDFLRFD